MRFVWPDVLWLLLLVPALIAAYVVMLRRRKNAAVRYASLTLLRDSIGAGQRIRRHVPPALVLLGHHGRDRRGRPADGHGDPAVAVHDHRPGHGRVAQHAGHRRRTESPRSGAGRGPVLHRRIAEERAARHRVVCRHGRGRADARPKAATTCSPRSTASSCSAPPPPAAACCSRCRCCSRKSRSTWKPALFDSRFGAGPRPTPLDKRKSADPAKAGSREAGADEARQLHRRRDHPAVRWTPHDRSGPARHREDGRRPRRARLHRRASARATARRSTSRATRSTCASTRRR